MLDNKKKDMTPFDMGKAPVKQYPFLLPLIWGGSWLMTRQFQLKISRQLRGVKAHWLVISTHQGFSDYYIAPLALFPHRANYISDMEGFAAFGEWLYRGIGCIGKRRYVSDVTVLLNMRRALSRGQSVVLFPESRHSNVGTTSYIPSNMGKLAKRMKAPVAVLTVHGSYLANPFWDEAHTRKVPMEAKLECLYTAEEVEGASEEELQRRIEDALQYDEYAWQWEHKIPITYPRRAQGLHRALYQCISCGSRCRMRSGGIRLVCDACRAEWEMDVYGRLLRGGDAIHIPDWYEWEREQTHKELRAAENCSFRMPSGSPSRQSTITGDGAPVLCCPRGTAVIISIRRMNASAPQDFSLWGNITTGSFLHRPMGLF